MFSFQLNLIIYFRNCKKHSYLFIVAVSLATKESLHIWHVTFILIQSPETDTKNKTRNYNHSQRHYFIYYFLNLIFYVLDSPPYPTENKEKFQELCREFQIQAEMSLFQILCYLHNKLEIRKSIYCVTFKCWPTYIT